MRHLRRLGHSLAAAGLAGAALAPLQLVLLPEVPVPPARMLLALAAWSSWAAIWLGLAAFVFVELASLGAPELGRRRGIDPVLGSWLVFAFSLLVALVAWWNRFRTRDLLVQPRREALGTVAVAVGITAAVLLLRGLRAHYRGRGGLVALHSLIAPLIAWSVLASLRPPAPTPPAGLALPASRRLLLVCLEGADLPWLLPALDRGDMPFLAAQRDNGAWAQVRTTRPFARSVSLTTLVTGCAPAVHGVNGKRAYRLPWLSPRAFSLLLEGPWPTPHQLPWFSWERAATPAPRRAPIWEIVERAGTPAGVVGWPGAVHARWHVPPPLGSEALPYTALDPDLRRALEPALAARPSRADATRTAFSVAAQVITSSALEHAREPVEALIVFSDLPLRLRPLWGGVEEDGEVLAQAQRMLDSELQVLWRMMGGEDVLLVVASPYGLAAPTPWRRLLNLLGGRRQWPLSPLDSPDGFVLLAGPGVSRNTRVRALRLADVTATTLYLLDLPLARDMAGRVVLDAVDEDWAATRPLRLVASYPAAGATAPAGDVRPRRGTGPAGASPPESRR